MLIGIIGKMGSGKTLLMTIIAFFSTRKVYSNYKIDVKNYIPLKVVDLLDLPNNVNVFIDEGYTWLESRTSTSHLNRYLSYIILQSRKRTIDIYISAQLFHSIDLRFREQCDIIVKCENIETGFRYKFLDCYSGKVHSFILPMKNASKFFGVFDTYEIVEPHTKQALELSLLDSDPKKKGEEIDKLANKLRPQLKKVTKYSVQKALLDIGYPEKFAGLVYSTLMGQVIKKK